jgi:hypothetical protein
MTQSKTSLWSMICSLSIYSSQSFFLLLVLHSRQSDRDPTPIPTLTSKTDSNSPELDLHEEQGIGRTSDKEQLHDGIIQRDVIRKEVEVSRTKDGQVQSLRLE